MKNKKGLSTVIATVLLILLVVVATSIVWMFVNNIVKDSTDKRTQSCFNAISSSKVTINDYYTCYNSSSGKVQFSINIGDVDVEGVVVSILMGGNSRSFTITNQVQVINYLLPYGNSGLTTVNLPIKNGGKTYIATGFQVNSKVDSIKIAPIIEGKQCDMSDSTYQVDDCSLLI
jgi:uncharacterized protein (UPF0333 family)